MDKTEIGFTVSEVANSLTRGKVFHRANLRHNAILSPEATKEAFATYSEMKPHMASMAVDSLCGFIADQLSRGNRLDFGAFSVGLALTGAIDGANALFNPEKNRLSVVMTPGKALEKAVKGLKPVNLKGSSEVDFTSVEQTSPKIKRANVLSDSQDRRVRAVIMRALLDFDCDGAGMWVESDAGEKLCVAANIVCDDNFYDCDMKGEIPKGTHWFVVCARSKRTHKFLRLTRRIEVVELT